MNPVNETLIRDVVAEVLARLNGGPAPTQSPSAAAQSSCGHNATVHAKSTATALRGKFGVFQDANEACAAAQEAFLQLQQKGVAARRKIEEIVKTLAEKNAEAWGRLELEETKIGRLDHKIENHQARGSVAIQQSAGHRAQDKSGERCQKRRQARQLR